MTKVENTLSAINTLSPGYPYNFCQLRDRGSGGGAGGALVPPLFWKEIVAQSSSSCAALIH